MKIAIDLELIIALEASFKGHNKIKIGKYKRVLGKYKETFAVESSLQ